MQKNLASGCSFACFLLFAMYNACYAWAWHLHFKDAEEYFGSENADYYETNRNLLIAVSSLIVISSFVFYPLFALGTMQTGLILRLLGNLTAMLIFLGYKAGVLSEDGLEEDRVKEYSFSNASDWGATIAFACAWVFISLFELNQMTFCTKESTRCGQNVMRWVVKFAVMAFWSLLAVAFCVTGDAILNETEIDFKDSKNAYSKILLAAAATSAVAALCFACFATCEFAEFLKLHMIFGVLTALLYLSAVIYESVDMRNEFNEVCEKYQDFDTLQDLCDTVEFIHNLHVAGEVFCMLAIAQVVGFDSYFFSTRKLFGVKDLEMGNM